MKINKNIKLKRTSYTLIGSALCLTILFSSCDKYLDHLPDQRTELNTPKKVAELLVDAYPGGNYITFCESMSDNVTDNFGMSTNDAINTDSYFWEDVTSTSQDSPIYYWNRAYRSIAAANHALEAIENAPDPQNYTAQKGEALVARAYAHFMLVSLFSKFYNPNTADTDLGIPYVKETESIVWKNYDRKTVTYVYEQIENDLTEGLPLISDASYTVPSYHFTKKAAHAFAVRFYLFKKQPAKVIEHANLAFPSNNFLSNLRPWSTKYQEITTTELSLIYTRPSQNANILIAETTSWWARRFRTYRYSLTANLRDRITSQTVVGNLNRYRWVISSGLSYYIRKFSEHFVRTDINATTGTGYTMVPLFTTEEVLLSRAEAYAIDKNYDAALADINLFIKERQTSFTPLTAQKVMDYFDTDDLTDALVKTCLQMRRAEFVHEGLRWFDILRYELPVIHRKNTGEEFVLKEDDLRKVLQLPSEVTLSGLELNPR